MADHYHLRREKILHQLRQDNLDGLLVSNPINVSYLTGFSGDSSFLLLSQKRALLISDGRFTTQIQEECPGLDFQIRPPAQTIQNATGEILKKLQLSALACDNSHLTLADFQTLKDATSVNWKPESGRVEKLRMIKDDWELQQIKAAIAVAEKAFGVFRALLRSGDTEKELADALEMYIRRAGGKCSSFPSIVAAGERAALPHANPTSKRVDEENLLLIDWGASGTFYKSDLTRVLFSRRKSTSFSSKGESNSEPKWQQIYNLVLQAQKKAIETLRPGAKTGAVDDAARTVISEAGYGDFFNHSIGHGLGMQVHEGPIMRPGSEIVLEVGMIVTVEPGIYLPGQGGVRIEDDVLVTEGGCEVLTSLPKDFDNQWVEY